MFPSSPCPLLHGSTRLYRPPFPSSLVFSPPWTQFCQCLCSPDLQDFQFLFSIKSFWPKSKRVSNLKQAERERAGGEQLCEVWTVAGTPTPDFFQDVGLTWSCSARTFCLAPLVFDLTSMEGGKAILCTAASCDGPEVVCLLGECW